MGNWYRFPTYNSFFTVDSDSQKHFRRILVATKDNKLLDTQTCQNQQIWRVCCSLFLHVKSKLRIKFAYLVFIIFDCNSALLSPCSQHELQLRHGNDVMCTLIYCILILPNCWPWPSVQNLGLKIVKVKTKTLKKIFFCKSNYRIANLWQNYGKLRMNFSIFYCK